MFNNWKNSTTNFLNKVIVLNLYLFAFGIFTSKALTSVSGGLICLFGLIQLIIMRVNPFKTINDKTLNWPILFFTFTLLFSIIEYPNSEAFAQLQKHLLVFFFFYIATISLNNLKQIKNIIIIATISMFLIAIYGFYQHYFLKIIQVRGFTSPLAFGCLLAIYIIFLMVYALWGKFKISHRIALSAGVIFLFANLLFSKARGSWLGFIGGVSVLSLLKNKKILVLLLIICLILNFLLPQVYIDRFKSCFDTKTNSSNLTRIALWKSALLMYRDHYINGVGLSRFSEEYETNYKQPYAITTSCHVHNNILQFMAEAGTIGLVGFVWLMVAILLWLYQYYRMVPDPNWRLFILASLCSVIVFNIQGLTEVNYGDAETLRFFWFLIAINMAIIKLSKNNTNQTEQQYSL